MSGPSRVHGLYDPTQEKDSCGVGLVADILARPSHQLVLDAATVLENMEHRGATGAEPNTGDGAGMLTALPHEFFARVARDALSAELPPPGRYAAGTLFLPQDAAEREHARRTFSRIAAEQGQRLLGWRPVPVDPDRADLGPTARRSMPVMEQLFLAAADGVTQDEFERQLYVIRKHAGSSLRSDARLREARSIYACSLSSRTIVYKGMLTPRQLLPFFPDLAAWDYRSHLALVHSRFSTNTMPTWDRAQPLRCIAHNGEINTLRANVNSMHDRERRVQSPLFGEAIDRLKPVAEPDTSDSGSFDNVLELLVMGGRSMPEALTMMIPEAWQNDPSMPDDWRAFYEFHSCVMEAWDGPAAIAFTDGRVAGATLDRNGLRPLRYYLTRDHRIVLASEMGVLPIEPNDVKHKGRIRPGRMMLIDFEKKQLLRDEDVKTALAAEHPYRKWLDEQRLSLEELEPRSNPSGFQPSTLLPRLRAFGYTTETLQHVLIPMVEQERDPLSSMGNDAALAVLSDQPRLVYDYFKQLFAQVTNPPIDPIREEIVMSLLAYIGPEGNLLEKTPAHCHRMRIPHPVLSNEELAALKKMRHRGWRAKTVDVTWLRHRGAAGLDAAIRRISDEVERAVDQGHTVVVLSDRNVSRTRVPMPSLIAVSAVHQHLNRVGKRTRVGLVVETGEAREVHHHCLLISFGADAINPYLAFEALWKARHDGQLDPKKVSTDDMVVAAYRKAVDKGLLKVMAKMGISTLQSYKGAQIFEALGLDRTVIDRCFTGTPSRLGGVGFDVLAEEAMRRHELGFPRRRTPSSPVLPNDGQVQWRAGGEKHMWDPTAIAALQRAVRGDDLTAWREFARHADEDEATRCTLRGLLRFKPTTPIPLEEVEPAKEIVKRFVTGAMSFGSLSLEAHTTLARAMNGIGAKSNSGEGGEDPVRYLPLPDGTPNPLRSRIKQVASGRFGVTIEYLAHADELQIKMAQGAKPGEGGELPGPKVDEHIARVRHSTPGVGLISPPPHHDIYSIEDLAQLIYDLKNANPQARISVKLVAALGVGTIAAGVAKAKAEHILISGHDGGTGASPLTSIKHAGSPWELGLAEAHQALVANDLRGRVTLQVDGQLKTGRDVVIAALLGAEEFGFATAPLISLGCVMMRKCHLNTCPVGIATQDPVLRARFKGQPEHVTRYLFMVAEDMRLSMARLGFRTVAEMVGRVELLEPSDAVTHWKARGLDLSPILDPARPTRPGAAVRHEEPQEHGLSSALDNRLLELARPALERGEPVRAELRVSNVNRAVGTLLSHHVARTRREPLPDDAIHFILRGTAGQSFGAWLARGVTLELHGDANDYVGKGLSGGTLVVLPPPGTTFPTSENIIVGNVALYGAVSGRAFFRGRAAERFAVRNSGAVAVVEGVGDHGCEYMTGGRVVVLGATGRNFAAGMSGGIAWVFDVDRQFRSRCNTQSVELERLGSEAEAAEVRALVEEHRALTGSETAGRLLVNWGMAVRGFVKVLPTEYRRALELERLKGPRRAVGA